MGSTQKHHLKINPYLDIISGITVVLSFSDGIIKIIGREGSGKSVLCQLLATELIEEDQEVVIFSDIPHSEAELHNPIQQQLHLHLDDNSDFYTALNSYIQARPFDQQKLILVFDDADQIPDDCFQAIRVLFEKNYHDRPEVSMVFAGTELLDQKLNEPANRTFNKNIILNFEVKPMNRSELEAFCNAYLVEMGLQKHHLSKDNLDEIFAETQGLPGKIPELIFAILDREEESKKGGVTDLPQEKGIISKLVELDDDPEPELTGLSVEDREEALTAYKDQVPWRWQSNGVGIAVVVLFLVVSYGYLVPEEQRTDSIVIFPPPLQSPGELSQDQLGNLAETLAQQGLVIEQLDSSENLPANEESQIPVEEIATQEVEAADPIDSPVPELTEQASSIGPVELVEEPTLELAEQEVEPPAEPTITEPELVTPDIAAETQSAEPQTASEQASDIIVTEQEPATEVEQEVEQIADTESAPEPDPAPEIDKLTFVDNWLAAWQDQDLDGYFAAYHSQFVPTGSQDLESWRNNRATSINRPADIEIDIESFEVVSESTQESQVRVQFTYQSSNYADRTLKDLVLSAENGVWGIREERNVSVEKLSFANTASTETEVTLDPVQLRDGESGFQAKIRQVLSLANMNDSNSQNSPFGAFINDWLGAWKNQDVEGYFRHYHDDFNPANFDSKSDWRADRMRKIHEKRFIDIAFDDIEILDEDENTTRIRFWLSYASSFYLDRTWKEVVLTRDQTGILQERNLAVEVIPFYP